ncbi:MAG TPA: hypothetical protein VMV89_08585, partial [Candidatus Paceibacterota bacterium]|nr:hypothetical protein [Candidatus Paceibacterota bacterium]
KNDFRKLSAAGLLVALAALTKYYGVCLVPLLAAYSLLETRRPGRWAACLLIPLAALCAYQWITRALYGRAMLSDAMDYAGYARGITKVSEMATILTALTFTGGCVAVAVFFMPLLWRARMLAAFAATAILISAALFFEGAKLEQFISPQATSATFVEIQIIFWAVGGIGVLALAVENLWNRRDAGAWLLALWVFGTFLFASVFNWTVNGRSILPMVPAVAILIVSRLERNAAAGWKSPKFALPVSLAVSAAFALLVARADYLFAVATRQTAAQTFARFGNERKNFWFEGHWGFQYYMESSGFAALDVKQSPIKPGDILALPENNTGIGLPNAGAIARQETLGVPGPSFLTTMNVAVAAGFYASVRGPLPFAFGKVPPEKVFLFFLKTNAPAPPEN